MFGTSGLRELDTLQHGIEKITTLGSNTGKWYLTTSCYGTVCGGEEKGEVEVVNRLKKIHVF